MLPGAVLATFAVVATVGCSASADDNASTTASADGAAGVGAALDGVRFDVRRDPGCGCCTSWVEYLRRHGATVELTDDADRASFRDTNGIDDDMASCHTAEVDGYVVEGHVPAGAIERMLLQRPEAAGLALPGMPSDAPGMGGNEASWAKQPVMLVGVDGALTAWDF